MTALHRLARLRREWWLLLLACMTGAIALELGGATAQLDHIAYDRLLSHRPPPATDDILIVALDERSLAAVGAWPWPRRTQADLVRRLAAGRPRAIGIDVLITEPRGAAEDRELAAAIRNAGNVFVPLAFTLPGRNGHAVDVAAPLPEIAMAAAGLGHVNLAPDNDGVMRSAYLDYAAEGQAWQALPAAMLGRRPPARQPTIEMTRATPVMIDYPGPSGTLASVSAVSVLNGEVPAELIAGKLVLVGMTASGLGDMHAAPFAGESPLMPGVEIQGSLLATLLAPHPLVPATAIMRMGFALAPVLLLFLALAVLPTRFGLLVAAGLVAAAAGSSAALLALGGLWLPPATPVIAVAASYAAWAWRRLAVASGYVSRELERVTREAGALAHPSRAAAGVLDRQLALLEDVTERERDLRQEHDAVIRLLSHDMRAPQSAILALLDSAADCPPALAARLRGYARRTLALADGFVNLSRAQLLELDDELIDLYDIALDAADTLWPQARARGMTIRVPDRMDLHDDGVLVRGDRSLLTRVLINLIDNAVKYGDPDSSVGVEIATSGSRALVTVRNAGQNIAEDQLGRIFEQFARSPGLGNHVDGFGLGLAFVHAVIRRHEGAITCRSADGETGFSVELPLAQA